MDLLTVLILVLLPRFEAVYHLRVDMSMVQLFVTRLNLGWFPAGRATGLSVISGLGGGEGLELSVLSRAWAWAGVLGSTCSQAWAGCPGMSVVSGLDEGRGPGRELGSQAWFEARGFGPERRLGPGSSLGLGLDWGAGLGGRVLDFCMVSGCRLGSWAQRDLRPQAWAGARVLSSVYSLGLGRGIHAMRTHLCQWFHYAISFSSSSSLSSSPFLKRNAEKVAAGKVRFSNWYWISWWQGLYSRDGHLGVTLIKFASDQSGLMEAMRLAEYFEKDDHGWFEAGIIWVFKKMVSRFSSIFLFAFR
ncbi:hypothetical protein BC332_07027 [Capsicum chinense]|nr:hypothetical protein BC332_07027 [Capsicum chinense]